MELSYEHLIGLAYSPERQNCYTLVRQIYSENFGVELKDYCFPSDWDADVLDIIPMVAAAIGAYKVEDWSIRNLRPGDVLALAIRSSNPNHLAVYLGSNLIAHHMYGQLSKVETLRDFWRMSTLYLLRHPDVPDITPELPSSSALELARARYNPDPNPETL